LTTDQPLLLVNSTTNCTLDFFDYETGDKVATLSDLVAQPHEMAWDPHRRLAYIAHTYRDGVYGQHSAKSHEVSVIDVASRTVADVIDIAPYHAPHDIEYDPELDLIITAVEDFEGTNGVVLIDGATRKVVANIPVDAPNSHWLALIPGRKLYVAHKEGEFMTVADLASRTVIGKIAFPGGLEEIDASLDGRHVFAVTPKFRADVDLVGSGHILRRPLVEGDPRPRLVKIDTQTDEVVAEVEFDDYNAGIRVGANDQVFITYMNFLVRPSDPAIDLASIPRPNGALIVVDGRDMTITGRVDVGPLPLTVRVTPDNSRAFVGNQGNGYVSVVDVARLEVVDHFDNNAHNGFGGTHGMVVIP